MRFYCTFNSKKIDNGYLLYRKQIIFANKKNMKASFYRIKENLDQYIDKIFKKILTKKIASFIGNTNIILEKK